MCSVIRVFLDEYNTFCDIPTNVDINILNKINKKSFEFSEQGIWDGIVMLAETDSTFPVLLKFRGYAMSNLCVGENLPGENLETYMREAKEIPELGFFIHIK